MIFLFYTLGSTLIRVLGEKGLNAVHAVLGLLVLSVGVELVVHGIVNHPAAH